MCDTEWGGGSWGIVWDFLSLPQRGYTTGYVPDELDGKGKLLKSNDDRTEQQLERFRSGLGNINVLRPPSPRLPLSPPASLAVSSLSQPTSLAAG